MLDVHNFFDNAIALETASSFDQGGGLAERSVRALGGETGRGGTAEPTSSERLRDRVMAAFAD